MRKQYEKVSLEFIIKVVFFLIIREMTQTYGEVQCLIAVKTFQSSCSLCLSVSWLIIPSPQITGESQRF